MKKMFLLVLVGVSFFTTSVFAETPKTKTTGTLPNGKSLGKLIERSQGKIESLQKADEAKGNFGKFSVTQTDGKKKDFELLAKTHIYTANSSPLVFSDLKKGDQVLVLYVVTLKGLNEVIAVTQSH